MSSSGRKVIVIGAAGALGQAVVRAYREEGAVLALIDRSRELLSSALGAESDVAKHHACDLFDSAAVSGAVQRALAHLGHIDAVCHVAGGFQMGEAVHETTDATWDLMMNTNARAFMNVARAVIPPMVRAGGGKIVAVGALGAKRGQANMGAYAASKRAFEALVESLSAEQRSNGINVNAVLPSIIDTPANRRDMPAADFSKWVAAEDLARVIVFLASDAAKPIHGACLPVQGLS
jgi:NAD(P)-dependent dehydrogenase (short-subunit alcohol dehydrogenase family)